MRQYIDVVQDNNGNAIVGATVTVKTFPAGTLASIFSDNGLTPIAASLVTTDATGAFMFYVADGDYTLEFRVNGALVKTQSPVSIFDGAAQLTYTDTGAINAYVITDSALEKALRTGLRCWMKIAAAHTNTGAATLQYNTLAAKAIVLPGGSPIAAGTLTAGGIYFFEYTGTAWQVMGIPAATQGVTNVVTFGADPTNVTDSTTAIQSAINFAATAIVVGAMQIFFPQGVYKVSSVLSIPDSGNMELVGAGKLVSIIKPTGTYARALQIGTGSAQVIRGAVRELQIDCRSATVQTGIYSERVEEHDFNRVAVFGATVAAWNTGYGYVNNFVECEASYGGDGFTTNSVFGTGGNNINNYTNCLVLSMTGFGYKVSYGNALNIIGHTTEQCAKAGMFINVMGAVKITGYFEGNGVTGHTFTTPAQTVKADIILCGSGLDTDMGAAFAMEGVSIDTNVTVPRATSNAFVFNAGANNVTISNNKTTQPTFVPLLTEMYTNTFKGRGYRLENNGTFTTQVSVLSASAGVNDNAVVDRIIDCPNLNIVSRNFADITFPQWSILSGGSANTYRKSATAGLTRFRGCDVWEINSTAASASDIRGFSLAAADYPDLQGKKVWFGMWVYPSAIDCYAHPFCGTQTFNNNPTAVTTWSLIAVSFTFPAAGTLDLGVRKAGATLGSVYFCAPMLCQDGFPASQAIQMAGSYLEGVATYDPPNLADGAGVTTTVTVTGAVLGDLALASFSLDLQGITVTAYVSAANTVSVRFQNESGGALDLASGLLRVRIPRLT